MTTPAWIRDGYAWGLLALWVGGLLAEWALLGLLPRIPISGQVSRTVGGEWQWVVRHHPLGDLVNFAASLLIVAVPALLVVGTREWLLSRRPLRGR